MPRFMPHRGRSPAALNNPSNRPSDICFVSVVSYESGPLCRGKYARGDSRQLSFCAVSGKIAGWYATCAVTARFDERNFAVDGHSCCFSRCAHVSSALQTKISPNIHGEQGRNLQTRTYCYSCCFEKGHFRTPPYVETFRIE